MYYFGHPDDCKIVRNKKSHPGFAVMEDNEGNNLFAAPDSWTDEQMEYALRIANHAFSRGVSFGQLMQKQEIRNALGIFT